jgi:hypothetical protein
MNVRDVETRVAAGWCRSVLCPAALVAALALGACGPPELEGTWVGRDAAGETVVYDFGAAGAGSRTVGGREEPMTYRVREGYPNLIEIAVGGPDSAQMGQGIVQVTWDGRMRLELGAAGAPAPRQISASALVLRRQATR